MSDKVNIEVNNNNLQDIRVDFFPFLSKNQSSQTYTFNFQPDSAKYNAQTVAAGGKIAGIGGPSGTKVFKAISTSPFQQQVGTGDSVSEGDIVKVELDSEPTAKETVEVVVTFADLNESKSAPDESGGRYLYNMIDTAQKVIVVDTDTDTVIQTINIPSSSAGDVSCMAYRDEDTSVYCFGQGRYVQIDADPASAKFNTIVKDEDITGQLDGKTGKTDGATYDFQDDLLFFASGENLFRVLDRNQNNAFIIPAGQFAGQQVGFSQSGASYIHSLRGVSHGATASFTFLDRNIVINPRINGIRQQRGDAFFYSPELGAFYSIGNGERVRVVTVQGVKMTVKAQISRSSSFGPNLFSKETGQLFCFNANSPQVDIIDLPTATRTASGSYQSSPSSVLTTNGAVAGNGFLYVRDDDNAQVYKLDPTKLPANMKVTTIPLNYTPAGQNEDTLIANKLKLL